MKHTPGPWWDYETLDGGVRIDAPSGLICRLRPDEDAKANARLIAAAPELLQMCTELLHEVEGNEKWRQEHLGRNYSETQLIVEARAAIAKATGEGE